MLSLKVNIIAFPDTFHVALEAALSLAKQINSCVFIFFGTLGFVERII